MEDVSTPHGSCAIEHTSWVIFCQQLLPSSHAHSSSELPTLWAQLQRSTPLLLVIPPCFTNHASQHPTRFPNVPPESHRLLVPCWEVIMRGPGLPVCGGCQLGEWMSPLVSLGLSASDSCKALVQTYKRNSCWGVRLSNGFLGLLQNHKCLDFWYPLGDRWPPALKQ